MFCNCLCFYGNLLIEKLFELMGYFKYGNVCFFDDLIIFLCINMYSKVCKYIIVMILCCLYIIFE